MNKLLTLLTVMVFSATLSAQVLSGDRALQDEMPEAHYLKATHSIGDFTVTDSDGVTWNLYEKLDSGKTVFIDMFFST